MAGASSRLLSLLNNPTSLLRHRPFALFRLSRRRSLTFPLTTVIAAGDHRVHLSGHNSLIPIKLARNFYSRPSYNAFQDNNQIPANDYHAPPSHPWIEWNRLLESLSIEGYFNGGSHIVEEFAANENLSMEFVAVANSCLAFARDRPDILGLLPRKDIEVLIEDGYPFLFKNADETERRMRSFLQVDGSNEASSVDLMKYVLSYASNPIIYPERNIKEATESSVRSLVQQITNLSYSGQYSNQFQAVGIDEEMPRNLGPNITMKKGDWICPKCNFMNFARNTKCLECEELRPQRRLTDGEWDCPQCNFFNYRRNTVCLKCECKRPGEVPLSGSPGPLKTPSERQQIGSHYRNNYDDFRVQNKNLEYSVNRNSNQFFGNISSDMGTLPADMFSKNKKSEKITEERSSENSSTYVQSRHISDVDKEEKSERWFKKVKELHGVTGPISDFPQIMPANKSNAENRFVDGMKKDRYRKQQAMEQGNGSGFVPFVPFPPDYFAKKDNELQPERSDSMVKPVNDVSFGDSHVNSDVSSGDSHVNSDVSSGYSHVNSDVSSGHSQANSVISSGHSHVNSNISYGHSQANSTISSGHSQANSDISSGHSRANSHMSSGHSRANSHIPSGHSRANSHIPSGHSRVNSTISYGHSQANSNISYGHSHANSNISSGHSHANSNISSGHSHVNSPISSGYSHVNSPISSSHSQGNQHMNNTNNPNSNTHSSSNQFTRNETINNGQKTPENPSGWTGKSLEGSAVTEPDPLDMSEEAKAERWFRRVAQIKDISELSQIPDEDFPSIMPMRKGVNRFVVSKRKTPLERRLTSPQYRKNLRITSSDPMKREGEEDDN